MSRARATSSTAAWRSRSSVSGAVRG
jgi:hypothetical protein